MRADQIESAKASGPEHYWFLHDVRAGGGALAVAKRLRAMKAMIEAGAAGVHLGPTFLRKECGHLRRQSVGQSRIIEKRTDARLAPTSAARAHDLDCAYGCESAGLLLADAESAGREFIHAGARGRVFPIRADDAEIRSRIGVCAFATCFVRNLDAGPGSAPKNA